MNEALIQNWYFVVVKYIILIKFKYAFQYSHQHGLLP